MMKIDKEIQVIDKNICCNLDKFSADERGFLSQNILSQLRNFVEAIAVKIYSNGADLDLVYDNITPALELIKAKGNYRFLSKFHRMLQITTSHYTLNEEKSERLMLKYYEYLLRIKKFLSEKHNIIVLENIDDFPLNIDTRLMEYYEKIASRIEQLSTNTSKLSYDDRYYIQKIKPFFVNHEIFYEVTFTVASDKVSKFDRVIAFTQKELISNYAVKLSVKKDYITILGKIMPILIIDYWEASVRPCELNNFSKFFGAHSKITSSLVEYRQLMKFLTQTRMSFTDLIVSSEEYFTSIKSKIMKRAKVTHFYEILEMCRNMVMEQSDGSNIIRYLLYRLNNKVLKNQYYHQSCSHLSDLNFKYKCIPFDQMPFNTSLSFHNPKILDLFDCIDIEGRKHELLARVLKNNTESKGQLFTPIKELIRFDDLDELVDVYNSKLYRTHTSREIRYFKKHLYIYGYASDSYSIIKRLQNLTKKGVANYSNSVKYWLVNDPHIVDCKEKKDALIRMFENSEVSMIYGSAGTGKSTMINHSSNFFNDKKKLYLANTNPAIENLRRKVNASNCTFKTVSSFLFWSNDDVECDILFIDECSTVSNIDMKAILDKASYSLLVLVGDVFQIESIVFGNWFSIARAFIDEDSQVELNKPYRTSNPNLLDVWERVRNLDDTILEPLVKNGYSRNLDDSIFDYTDEDQIILCLNYDGLYGINNINRFLQANNQNPPIEWGINIYKVNDPILFNQSERFAPLIYNNLKGKIVNIVTYEDRIQFDIEIDKVLNSLDVKSHDLELLDTSTNGKSLIRFDVNKYRSTDDDDMSSDAIVPFQVAYTVSIHKAQGLEYNSVKIVIINEIEELITHNIFYTAITRAKEKLTIYWTPETESYVLQSLETRNYRKDAGLLTAKYKDLSK